MRSENDIFDLIHKIVFEDEKILAVYMNGSRTNPNVKKDIFQDYHSNQYMMEYEYLLIEVRIRTQNEKP